VSRSVFSTTVLADGRALVVGGNNLDSNELAAAELFQ
jgi:hypothetical protein